MPYRSKEKLYADVHCLPIMNHGVWPIGESRPLSHKLKPGEVWDKENREADTKSEDPDASEEVVDDEDDDQVYSTIKIPTTNLQNHTYKEGGGYQGQQLPIRILKNQPPSLITDFVYPGSERKEDISVG